MIEMLILRIKILPPKSISGCVELETIFTRSSELTAHKENAYVKMKTVRY